MELIPFDVNSIFFYIKIKNKSIFVFLFQNNFVYLHYETKKDSINNLKTKHYGN